MGFSSAGITTGTFGNDVINNIQQKQIIGAYYKKVFNELDVDINDVALYLEKISDGNNKNLYNSAEVVLDGDRSDSAIADMMLNGFEQCRESQKFIYTRIGEKLNENNKYTAYGLIRLYDKFIKNGIKFSQNITDTYNELINTDENTSKETFNYLVGKLSATMDAVVPRASVAAEIVKRINTNMEENGLLRREAIRNDSIEIDEEAVVDGIWGRDEKVISDYGTESAENSQFESVENLSDDDIIRMAREYLRSPEGKKDTRPYLWHRPSFGKNQEQIVYDNGKNIFGNVYDPSGAMVLWDLSKPRKGQWDMGHVPGQKYSVIHARYVEGMMTPEEFLQWYRDPRNYRPELPSTNRSHKYE